MPEFEHPEDLRYTAEHEWLRLEDDGTVRLGLTAHAQGELDDVVQVTLPGVGERVVGGTPCGEVESTLSVADLYAPFDGVVTASNEHLEGSPELVNSDPYGEGWLLRLRPDDPSAAASSLDAAAYRAQLG